MSSVPPDEHPNFLVTLSVPDLPDDTDALTAALAYAASGWYIIPTDPRDVKNPGSILGHGWQTKSSRDPKQITAWFAGTDYGIALHCGRSGAVVFDVDSAPAVPPDLAAALSAEPYQSTRPDEPGRGHHLFLQPAGRTLGNGTGRLGGGWGEVRGLNGVIVASPTPHPDGGEYRWLRTGPVPKLPYWLHGLLDDATPAEGAVSDTAVAKFLDAHTRADRPNLLNGWKKMQRNRFAEGYSRHETTQRVLVAAMEEAAAGLIDARTAADTLGSAFVDAVTKPSSNGRRTLTAAQARREALGMLRWAVAQARVADTTTIRSRAERNMPINDDNASAEPEPSGRRARITWAHTINPEPVKWFWEDNGEGRLPAGSLSQAAGREGTGKSSFGLWLTARTTTGTLPGCFYGTPMRVLYVAVEDSWKHTLVPRLIAAGADLSMVGRFEVVEEGDDELALSLPHDNAILESAIVEHNVALVVVDPLMSAIGDRIDSHKTREVRSALDPLAKLADRTGAVILGIAHFNKSNGTDAASLITGAGAFKDVPRSVFGFARDNNIIGDNNRVMTQVKNSLGRDDLPSLSYAIESAEIDTGKGIATTGRFVFLGNSERSVADVLRDNNSGGRDRDDDLDEHDYTDDFKRSWLYEYLLDAQAAGQQVRPKDAVAYARDDLGISRATVYRLFEKLANAGMVEAVDDGTFPKVTYWQLAGETTVLEHPNGETTETTGLDLHKQDETTGELWDDSETTGKNAPDQAEQEADSPVVSVVSPDRGETPPPGAPTAHTPGMTARVQQTLAKGNGKPICPTCNRAPARADTGECDLCTVNTNAVKSVHDDLVELGWLPAKPFDVVSPNGPAK